MITEIDIVRLFLTYPRMYEVPVIVKVRASSHGQAVLDVQQALIPGDGEVPPPPPVPDDPKPGSRYGG